MSKSTLEVFQYDEQAAKHASWETFESTLLEDSNAEVVNGIQDDSGEHIRTVLVKSEILSDHTCLTWGYLDLSLNYWPCYRDGFEEPSPNNRGSEE